MNTDTATYCGAHSCGKLAPAGTLCTDCHTELEQHVGTLPWDLAQLQTQATNQAKFTKGGGSKSTETPLMFNPYASATLASLVATVHIWQARLADHIGTPVRYPNPIAASRWINEHVDQCHTFIDAGQMLDAFAHARQETERTINRPPDRQYLGDCNTTNEDGHTCPGRVTAHPTEPEAKCDTCSLTIDAAKRRLDLLCELDDKKLTAAECARIATYMGLTIGRDQVRKRINQWSARGRILVADHDPTSDDPRYTFREVRLMLDQDETTRKTA